MERHKYTEEQDRFISENINGRSLRDIYNMFLAKFNDYRSFNSFTTHCYSRGYKTGLQAAPVPKDIAQYIKDNVKGNLMSELTEMVNVEFGVNYSVQRVRGYCKNHKYTNGLQDKCQFKYPVNPIKKGEHKSVRTEFHQGDIPSNKTSIGTERIRGDGQIWVKTGEGNNDWTPKQFIVYEKEKGSIPSGMSLMFLDGNRQDCDIDNLIAVPKSVILILNRKQFRTTNRELTRAAVNTVILEQSIRNKESEHEKQISEVS